MKIAPASLSIAIFFTWAVLLILQRPGLQYDEALLVSGSVHMLNSPAEFALPHDPDTWICALGRCFPLMSVRYVGPIKDYLCLPLFGFLGIHVEIVRLVSMFLAAIGIFGVVRLVDEVASRIAAAAAGLALAFSPTYVSLSVFDNNAVGQMMAAIGLLCWSTAHYIRRSSARSAFWIGVAVGFGIWARANHLLFSLALGAALLLILRKSIFRIPWSHWLTAAAGAVLAGAPFLLYQIRSGGGTWQAVGMMSAHEAFSVLLRRRLAYLSEILIYARENRAMWHGPALPAWQSWLVTLLVVAACLVAFRMSDRQKLGLSAKVAALTLLLLTALLFLSQLEISEHHLVAILPIAAVVAALAGSIAAERSRTAAGLVAIAAILYLGVAAYWQISAIRGLARTGGVGAWSDGISTLTSELSRQPDPNIKVLDWGLAMNMYVLSNAKLRPAEIYGAEDHEPAFWTEVIRQGGVFVLNPPSRRFFPQSSRSFLNAVMQNRPAFQVHNVLQRSGQEYAQVFLIAPDSFGKSSGDAPRPGELDSNISAADERHASQFQGFYSVEQGRWRWSQPEFSITLPKPAALGQTFAELRLRLYVPAVLIQRFHEIALSARLNEHILAPETFRQTGDQTYEREIKMEWLSPDTNTFHFTLDKFLPPSTGDGRRLGIIVAAASLESW